MAPKILVKPEVKPKRKYVRKEKKLETISETITISLPDESEECKELQTQLDKMEIEEPRSVEDIMREIYRKGYNEIKCYLYYEGTDIDTLKFLKRFQEILDSKKIGSQIVVVSNKNHIEKIGINNFYVTDYNSTGLFWAMCLSRDLCKCIKIKEIPKISPEEFYELVKDKTDYEDDYIQIVILQK